MINKKASIIKLAAVLLYRLKSAGVSLPPNWRQYPTFYDAVFHTHGTTNRAKSLLRRWQLPGANRQKLWEELLGIPQEVPQPARVPGRGMYLDKPLPVAPGTRKYGKRPTRWEHDTEFAYPIYE